MGINRNRFLRKKGSEWIEWLSDDLPPSEPQIKVHNPNLRRLDPRRERLRQAGVYNQSQPGHHTAPNSTVSIQINLPKLKLSKINLPSPKQLRYWGTFTGVLLILSIGVRAGGERLMESSHKVATKGPAVATKPTFKPVGPKDNQALATTGGAYDAQKQVYSYRDTLLNSPITVSQQALPAQFSKNPDTLKQLAGSIGAKESFEMAFGTVYVATSENHTSQRLMFIRRDLLVFIESAKTYDNDTWKFYIESLR